MHKLEFELEILIYVWTYGGKETNICISNATISSFFFTLWGDKMWVFLW